MHVHPGVIRQFDSHPSFETKFPSSHGSIAALTPFPQTAQIVFAPLQYEFDSI